MDSTKNEAARDSVVASFFVEIALHFLWKSRFIFCGNRASFFVESRFIFCGIGASFFVELALHFLWNRASFDEYPRLKSGAVRRTSSPTFGLRRKRACAEDKRLRVHEGGQLRQRRAQTPILIGGIIENHQRAFSGALATCSRIHAISPICKRRSS